MSDLHVRHLLIGGGVAGGAAARAVRELDRDGSILLIAREHMRPYHRPPLSKAYLRRAMPHSEVFTHAPGWFEEHRIELHSGLHASHIDTARAVAALSNGREVSFDRLLLAVGAHPIPPSVPGAGLPNLFTLRTLDDCDVLHHAIDKALREGRRHAGGRGRATVIGGGTLGVEIASSLTRLGLAVDLLLNHEFPWARFAGQAIGRFAAGRLEREGVKVHPHATPRRLEGDGRVQRVILPDDRFLECDFAVAAVGAAPNRDLLHGTPIAAGRAILTDAQCRTNVPGIYAAGDCAAMFDPLFGRHRVLEHWSSAIATGALAGRNMAGANETWNQVSEFTTELFDLSVTVLGDERHIDRRLLRGTTGVDSPGFVEFGIAADGRIVQALAAGRTAEIDVLRKLIAGRVCANGNEELLKDPASDLGGLLKNP